MSKNLDGNTSAAAGTWIPSSAPFGGTFPQGKAGNGLPRGCGPRNDGGRGIPSSAPAGHLPPRGRQRARIKRAAAEAAGWSCALALWIVVAAMEGGVLRPVAGAALGLGLELIGALALYKAGVVRFPDTGNAPHQSPAAPASPRGSWGWEAERW